jgi:hypothetical protein
MAVVASDPNHTASVLLKLPARVTAPLLGSAKEVPPPCGPSGGLTLEIVGCWPEGATAVVPTEDSWLPDPSKSVTETESPAETE